MVWHCTYPEALPLQPKGCVAVLGNFDGVHAGHRQLLATAGTLAHSAGLPLVVLTFFPHPRSVLRPEKPFVLLQTLPERTQSLADAGADGVAVLPFTPARALQQPEDFIAEVIEGWLQAKQVVIGTNFRFGHRAAGTPDLLKKNQSFQTHIISLAGDEAGPFSSSRLREQTR